MALMAEASIKARHALVAMKFDNVANGARIGRIEARTEGIISYLLTHLGVSERSIFEFYNDHAKIISTSWSGKVSRVLPYTMISTSRAGFLKPVTDLVLGIALIVVAYIIGYREAPGLMLGLLGVYLTVNYLISKTAVFELHCNSGDVISIVIKRGILDWTPVNEKEALAFVDRLNEMIVLANS